MMSLSDTRRLVWGALGLGWLTVIACVPPSTASRPPASAGPARTAGLHVGREQPTTTPTDAVVAGGFELPTRRSRATSSVEEPPALPASIPAPLELTIELTTTITIHGHRTQRRQDVARGLDRVHVRGVDDGVEWLFLQNPVDRRRVSGRLVDHRRRAIIDYDESELRMSGIARGWADIVCLGIGTDALQGLTLSGRIERRFGFEFREWRSAEVKAVRDVWWSDEALMPWRVSVDGSSSLEVQSTIEVTSIRRGLERERLVEPRERLPTYVVIDVADDREAHHGSIIPPAAMRAAAAKP